MRKDRSTPPTTSDPQPEVVQEPAPLGPPAATQPIPPAIDMIRRRLLRLLGGTPTLDDGLLVAEALDLLTDVRPPYALPTGNCGPEIAPSSQEDSDIIDDVVVEIADVLRLIETVVAASTDVRELSRLIGTVLALQQVLARRELT